MEDAMKWRPIEDAPKDGTPIIGAWQCLNGTWDMDIVRFVDWDWWNYYFDGTHTPTHWMTLPDPPEIT